MLVGYAAPSNNFEENKSSNDSLNYSSYATPNPLPNLMPQFPPIVAGIGINENGNESLNLSTSYHG